MAQGDARYQPVNDAWKAAQPIPPCTREEAAQAVKLLCARFGKRDGGPWQLKDFKAPKMFRPWIDPHGRETDPINTLNRGWARIAHDLSHMIFDRRVGPELRRRHSAPHARFELEITQYIIASGWLTGSLQKKAKPKPTVAERRARMLAQIDANTLRWERKASRAAKALRKLQARRKYLVKVMGIIE